MNSTVKYIDEWVAHYDAGNKLEFTNPQKMYIARLSFLFFSEAKSRVDFKLLASVISRYGLMETLNSELETLTNKKNNCEIMLRDNDFDEEDLAYAEGYLADIMARAIEQAESDEEISYTEKELGISPEESVRNSIEKQKKSIETELKKLQSCMSFVQKMGEE